MEQKSIVEIGNTVAKDSDVIMNNITRAVNQLRNVERRL
jgi:hypothetical protein